MKPKHQRMWLVGLAVLAVAAASGLALSALKDQAAYFYSPSDIRKDGVPIGRAIRLGGLVRPGSLQKAADGVTLRFVVTDGAATTPMTFEGIPPDLFREGSGVVAEGQFQRDGGFVATNLLAKHDEKYQPPEMAGKMHETRSLAR